MQFYISVYFQGKDYCLKVEITKLTRELAEYKISGRNRSITLQTNSPFLRSQALKYKSSYWKIIDGIPPVNGFLENIIKQLEIYESGMNRENS